MFEQIELPPELCSYLCSFTPLLGISGTIESQNFFVVSKYFPVNGRKLVILFTNTISPKELSLNVLRKGDDSALITAFHNSSLEQKLLAKGRKIQSPSYSYSVVSFELLLNEEKSIDDSNSLAIYDVVYANGVTGLDPSFNDSITIAKTLEVMSLTAVDKYIIGRKL
ncbi:MAG: hypothetical protein ACTSUR_06380 [Candidatus Heimdallarchaeaceae archaeon]